MLSPTKKATVSLFISFTLRGLWIVCLERRLVSEDIRIHNVGESGFFSQYSD